MNDKEAIDMMRRCSSEIKGLRSEISRLELKAQAYDDISALLRLFPGRGVTVGEGLAWVLDKRIKEVEKALEESMVASG